MRKYLGFTLALLLAFPVGAMAGTLYDDGEIVIDSTNLYPKTDGGSTLGKSGNEFAGLFVDSITMGGVEKTSWGSVISPMTDASGYVNPTDAGNYVRFYDTGYLRLGDATNAGSYYILTSDDSDSWYAGQYTTSDDYVIGYGSAIGTDIRLSITDDANTTTITIGEGTDSYDKALIFDGNAYDFYMAYDDSADDLLIGLGAAVGTTPAISITNGLAITTYAGITMTGTAPVLTVGDAGEEDTTLLFDGNAQDFYVALDDSVDDLLIGLGNAVGTTPAISITDGLAITTYGAITMTGTTPTLTVGDGGNEDNMVVFNGTLDFTVGVDTTASVFEICNGVDLDQTCALSIDANEDIILPSGSLYMVDDEFIYWGTNSDWSVQYDEAVDDQLLFLTAGTGCTATTDPMVEFVVGATPTADQQVFGVSKGTQASNTPLLTLDEDGDIIIAGTSTLTGAVSATGDITMTGTTPLLTIGDAGAEDNMVYFVGQTDNNFCVGTDATDDTFVIAHSNTLGTDNRIAIDDDANNTKIVIGDGASYDHYIVFDGASTADYYMGYDHTGGTASTCFTIGYGSAVGTTPIIDISSAGVFTLTSTGGITATNVADVVRAIQFTPANFTENSSLLSSAGGTNPGLEIQNNLTAIVWSDGESSHVKVTFKIPADYASGGAFRAFIDTTNDSAATYLGWSFARNASGTGWDATPTTETSAYKQHPFGAGAGTPTTVTLTPTAAGWPVSAGDIITVSLWRDDTGASTSALELYYLDFFYTATQ